MTDPRQDAYELIARLVAFDTTSRDSNLALIDFVAGYLAGFGVDSRRIYDDSGKKANLFATLGPARAGGVVLAGHSDVVPVDGQDWDSDPFTVVRKGARLYGRGTADMKSFPAVVLSLVPDILARDLERPVHLALTYDEEVGCLGVPRLIEMINGLEVKPAVVIVGEPTEMKVVNRHKGVFHFRTTATGLESHSAYPDRGVSAIRYAAEALTFLHHLADRLRARADGAGEYEPPYHSLNVGRISGGSATNIVPRHCAFDWDVRLVPGGDIAALVSEPLARFVEGELLPRMRAVSDRAGLVTELLGEVPGLAPEAGSSAEALARELTGDNSPAGAISFGTEAGLYRQGGLATVVCGPGSIRQAHRANEYIEVAQVEACLAFMRRLIDKLARR